MAVALICTSVPLDGELDHTFLWRHDFVRHTATTLEEAQRLVHALQPAIVVVNRDLPWAERFVTLLRRDLATRPLSVVIVARGGARAAETGLLDAGADAVLRLPAAQGWDDELVRLMGVPLRRQQRLPLQLRLDAQVEDDLVSATVLNLSVYGMLVQSPVALEVGREIDFAFRLPDGGPLITGQGRVLRQDSPTLFGIEFLALEDDDRQRISRLTLAAGEEA